MQYNTTKKVEGPGSFFWFHSVERWICGPLDYFLAASLTIWIKSGPISFSYWAMTCFTAS